MEARARMSFECDITLRRGERDIAAHFASSGGVTALVGPSGQGKTSTLDAIAGLLRPERGRIAVGGVTLFDRARGIDLAPEARAAGYVFQDLRLFPHLTVRDNLLFGWRHAPPERGEGGREALESWGYNAEEIAQLENLGLGCK